MMHKPRPMHINTDFLTTLEEYDYDLDALNEDLDAVIENLTRNPAHGKRNACTRTFTIEV